MNCPNYLHACGKTCNDYVWHPLVVTQIKNPAFQKEVYFSVLGSAFLLAAQLICLVVTAVADSSSRAEPEFPRFDYDREQLLPRNFPGSWHQFRTTGVPFVGYLYTV